MSLSVRRVSLRDDREEMLGLLNRNFGNGQDKRFDWRHFNNPVGEAWAWFVCKGETAVATASVFPRWMYVDQKVIRCGQVGGFAVDAAHRTLGPAVMLQRKTFEPVDSGAIAFCYDCPPHDRGMSTFVRMGMRANTEVLRYALPLTCDEMVRKKLGNGPWAKPVAGIGNALMRMRPSIRSKPGLEVKEQSAVFGEEFDELDRRVSSAGVIRASRSAELLNWRYRENPGSDTRVMAVRRSGELLGFLSLWTCGERAYVVDLFGRELPTIGLPLMQATIEVCKRERVLSLHGFCSQESELRHVFAGAGFRPRQRDARVVAYEGVNAGGNPLLNSRLTWAFSHVELMV